MMARKPLTYTVLALLVVLIIWYSPALFQQRHLFEADTGYFFEPLCRFIGANIRAGRVPLWNPFLYCGMPQAAVSSPGVFYPFTWLFAIPNFDLALALYVMCHQLICAVGMFLLVTELGWGVPAAIVAAAVGALNGYFLTTISNFTLAASACYLPLQIWAALRIDFPTTKNGFQRLCVLALAVAFSILAGRPETFVPALCVVALVCVALFVKDWKSKRNSSFALFAIRAAGMIAGVCLAAPVLAPAIEWWRLSSRAQGMDPAYVLLWSANWYDFANLLLLQPFGNMAQIDNPYRFLVASRQGSLPYVPTAFVGPVVLLLACIGLFNRDRKAAVSLFIALIVFGIFAAGQNTPVLPFLLQQSKYLTLFRYPVKLLIFVDMALALLCALGVKHASEGKLKATIVASFLVCVLPAALGAYLLYNQSDLLVPVPRNYTGTVRLFGSVQEMFGRSLISSATTAAAIGVLCLMRAMNQIRQRTCEIILVSTVVISLGAGLVLCRPAFSDKDVWGLSSASVQAIKERVTQSGGRFMPVFLEPFQRFENLSNDGNENYFLHTREMLFGNETMDAGVRSAYGYEGAPTGRYREIADTSMAVSTAAQSTDVEKENKLSSANDYMLSNLCKLTSASIVGTTYWRGVSTGIHNKLDERFFQKSLVLEKENITLFKHRESAGRAFFARKLYWCPNWQALFSRYLNGPLDETVFVQRLSMPSSQEVNAVGADDKAQIIEDATDTVAVKTSTSGRRLLVLCDTIFPGWKASVDGVGVPILKANAFFRAVWVPKGSHIVTFHYRPTSVLIGLLVAIAAAASLGAVYFARFRIRTS